MARRRKKETVTVNEQNPLMILIIGVLALLVIVLAVNILFARTDGNTIRSGTATQPLAGTTGGTLAPIKNGVQEVAISMQRGQYQPYPVRVKVGTPVRMTVDLNTVNGCYRSIIIPELGVSGRVGTGGNTIEFTPTKAGTFRMTCGMGMADGQIIVEDENGIAPAAVAGSALPIRAAGGSCGSGGCGCGG
jgi:heme/copper-type cytochrome/quinol oxidase subunit 2